MILDTFSRIVRPACSVSLADSDLLHKIGDQPVLFYGSGKAAADTLVGIADATAYGSAVAIDFAGVDEVTVAQLDADLSARHWRAWFLGKDVPGLPDTARTWVKAASDGGSYSTHRAYLRETVRRTAGPVLELGCGDGSTPMLHDECCVRGYRFLLSVDSDEAWLARFADLRLAGRHEFRHAVDPASVLERSINWDVVFVDHAPGETRRRAVELAHGAKYVVVHDTDDLGYELEEALSRFRYRRDFRRLRPWTTVVSDTLPIFEEPAQEELP